MGKCKWMPPEGDLWKKEYEGCPHPPHGDYDYCIFHFPLEEKRNDPSLAIEFKTAFDGFFNGYKLKDEAGDFRGFVFPNGIDLSKSDFRRSYERDNQDGALPDDHMPVNFGWAIFGDEADFRQAKFGDKAYFWAAKFGDKAEFRWAKFGDEADFRQAKFGDEAYFWEAKFGDRADFRQAKFGDEADFRKAKFGDKASFWNAYFGDQANFGRAAFLGSVDFSDVKAAETAFVFSGVHLKKSGDLDGLLKKPSSSRHLLFRETRFEGPAIFHNADLSRVRFEMVDLQNLSFFKSRISQTEFVSCQWGSGPERRKHWRRSSGFNFGFRRPRLLLDELILRKQNQKPARQVPVLLKPIAWLWSLHIAAYSRVPEVEAIDKMKPIKDLQAEDIEILGLQFKQSLEATKDPITAGDFHFCVMEMKLEKARAAGRFWRSVGLTLYKFINGYGERYARTLMWLALLVAISTLLFAWQGETLFEGYKSFSARLEPAFFWACQHILPFKFGTELWTIDVKDSAMRWLTMGETFIGSTLFAFMILAMRRRFKR